MHIRVKVPQELHAALKVEAADPRGNAGEVVCGAVINGNGNWLPEVRE